MIEAIIRNIFIVFAMMGICRVAIGNIFRYNNKLLAKKIFHWILIITQVLIADKFIETLRIPFYLFAWFIFILYVI